MSPHRPIEHWIEVGDEYLADGRWHDGLQLMEKMWAAIPPGVAIRKAESEREHSSRTPERLREVSKNRLVNIGRRSMVRQLITGRVRFGLWEADPWPVPPDGWKVGGWDVRDLRPTRTSLAELGRQYHITGARLKELIDKDPPLERIVRGRWLYLPRSELPALEWRVNRHKVESNQRRGNGPRQYRERLAEMEPTEISLTQLARRANLAVRTAGQLRDEHPELPWLVWGRGSRYSLPLAALPAWDQVVKGYLEESWERRSAASRRGAKNRRSTRKGRSAE